MIAGSIASAPLHRAHFAVRRHERPGIKELIEAPPCARAVDWSLRSVVDGRQCL